MLLPGVGDFDVCNVCRLLARSAVAASLWGGSGASCRQSRDSGGTRQDVASSLYDGSDNGSEGFEGGPRKERDKKKEI
ncbi:hypothetical protein MRX96_035849 [Rhipicephalus microplus]